MQEVSTQIHELQTANVRLNLPYVNLIGGIELALTRQNDDFHRVLQEAKESIEELNNALH